MDHGINLKYNDKLSDIVFVFLFFPKPLAMALEWLWKEKPKCVCEKIPELHLTPESVTSNDLEVM